MLKYDDFTLPIPVQQTLLETVGVLAPHCSWGERKGDLENLIKKIQSSWEKRKVDVDPDHFQVLKSTAETALESLRKTTAS